MSNTDYSLHIVKNLLCRTWDNAQADCQSQNANLLKIDTVEEMTKIKGTPHTDSELEILQIATYLPTYIVLCTACVHKGPIVDHGPE